MGKFAHSELNGQKCPLNGQQCPLANGHYHPLYYGQICPPSTERKF